MRETGRSDERVGPGRAEVGPIGSMGRRLGGRGVDVLDTSGPFAGDVLLALSGVFYISSPYAPASCAHVPPSCLSACRSIACLLVGLAPALPHSPTGSERPDPYCNWPDLCPFLSLPLPLPFLFHPSSPLSPGPLTPCRPADSFGNPWAPHPSFPLSSPFAP